VSEKSLGKWVKAPVESIPKAHASLPNGALASGMQNCGAKLRSRTSRGGVYCRGLECRNGNPRSYRPLTLCFQAPGGGVTFENKK